MRLFRHATISFLLLAAPALAEETSFERFPFETKAGTYQDLIVASDADADADVGGTLDMRLVFPSVTVERASGDRVALQPGEERRVVVQTGAGRGGYETSVNLYFADRPLVLARRDGRVEMNATLKSIAIPLLDNRDAAFGTVVFPGEGLGIAISWPTRAAPTLQTVDMVLGGAGMQVDARLLSVPGATAPRMEVGAVDLRGRAVLRLTDDPAGMADILASVERIEIDRSRAALLGGGVAASGVARVSPGADAPLTDLNGTLALGNFSIMIQRAMTAQLLAPEQLMPLAILAGGLGTLTPDGTLTFRIETTADGGVIVNDRPTAFRLRE